MKDLLPVRTEAAFFTTQLGHPAACSSKLFNLNWSVLLHSKRFPADVVI